MNSLRQKIALFLGLSSLTALLVGVATCVLLYESRVRRQSGIELDTIARSVPAALESSGRSQEDLVRTIALTHDVFDNTASRNISGLWLYLSQLVSANRLDFAEIVGYDGLILVNLADSSSVRHASSNPLVYATLNESACGYGLLRQPDGDLYLIATAPIARGGSPLGAITLGRLVDRELLNALVSVPSIRLTVWTNPAKNALVVQGTDLLPPLDKILSPAEKTRVQSGRTLTRIVKNNGAKLQATFFSQADLNGDYHFFAVYRSMRFLTEAAILTLMHLLLIVLLVSVLVAQIAWWVSRRVAEPLVALTRAAKGMAAFNFNEEVPVTGRDEIADLAHSFNLLSRSLRENVQQKDRYAAELSNLNNNLERLVARRTEQLSHTNQLLKREMADKEDFLRTVSHDLGAPLRNIAGLIRLLERRQRDSLDDASRDMLARISNNIKNELQMIEQLLELSRIKTRRTQPVKIELCDLLGQIAQDLSFSIEERRVNIRAPEDLPCVYAERNRMRQLFQNLLDNAIKYMGDQSAPSIEVGWSQHPRAFMFWVSDNGMGIPADHKDKIFGVFRRVRRTETKDVEGKGVGLASVKTIVEMYGGEIWVESELGKGSTFYFTLDRALTSAPATFIEDEEAEDQSMAAAL